MIFASFQEAMLAYSERCVATHAAIQVRLPEGRQIKNEPLTHPANASTRPSAA